MYFLILTLPYGLFNRWMRKVDFIQQKFIVSTIFVTTLALTLLYSGAFRFIMEKFKVVNWKEVIENSKDDLLTKVLENNLHFKYDYRVDKQREISA